MSAQSDSLRNLPYADYSKYFKKEDEMSAQSETPELGSDGLPFPQTFDAMAWGKEFNKRFPSVPVDDALGWFANAIMRGHDTHAERQLSAQGEGLDESVNEIERLANLVAKTQPIWSGRLLKVVAALRAPQAAPSAPAAPSAQLNMLVDREGMKTLIKDTPDMDFEIGASTQCPMCGDNWPHEHSAKETVIFKNGMKRERKRQEVLRYGPAKFEVTGQMRAYLEAAIPKSNHLSEAMIDAGVAEATNKEGEWSDYVTRIYLAMRGKEVSAPSAKGWAIKGPEGGFIGLWETEEESWERTFNFKDLFNKDDAIEAGYTAVQGYFVEGSAEPVATKLVSDPYDERDGPWFSQEDLKKLRALPAGAQLFTTPTADDARRLLERAKAGCIGYATMLHYDEQISESQEWKIFAQQIDDHLTRSGK